jgi:hypothetical protein
MVFREGMGFRKKVLLVLGTLGIITAGARHMWKIQPPPYEKNVTTIHSAFTQVAVVGDTGEDNTQREWLIRSLERRPVKFVLMAGDNCYDIGCLNKAQFKKNFEKPFTERLNHLEAIIATQGNHDNASLHEEERDFMIDLLKDGPVSKVHMRYYYTGYTFVDPLVQKTDYCLGTADNTMYMAKFGDPPAQDRQDAYLRRLYKDPRCRGARLGLLWHIPVLSAGDHGDTKFKDQVRFYREDLRGKVQDIFSGHDHNMSFDGCFGSSGDEFMNKQYQKLVLKGDYLGKIEYPGSATCHMLSGSGSKLRELKSKPRVWAKSAPGYIWITKINPATRLYQYIEAQENNDKVVFEMKVVDHEEF